MLLSREGKVIQIHFFQMSVTLLGNPGISYSSTFQIPQRVSRIPNRTLGLQFL